MEACDESNQGGYEDDHETQGAHLSLFSIFLPLFHSASAATKNLYVTIQPAGPVIGVDLYGKWFLFF